MSLIFFFFQAEDGIRDLVRSRGLGDVYKRQLQYMMFFTEFGVGVADRTNGTSRYVNAAQWADGTAT